MSRWPVAGPSEYWLLASSPASKVKTAIHTKFYSNRSRTKDILYEEQYIFFITSRTFLLSMRHVADNLYRENQNTHFVFSNSFFFFRKSTVNWITWKKNCSAGGRPQITIWRIRIAYHMARYHYHFNLQLAFEMVTTNSDHSGNYVYSLLEPPFRPQKSKS